MTGVPANLVHLLPNMMLLPRSMNMSFTAQDQGFRYSMVGGAGSTGAGNASGIGFDWQVTNGSGVQITVETDGMQTTLVSGEIKSLTNIPFDIFRITNTTGATVPNAIDVILMGLQMSDVISYTKSPPDFHRWS